MTTIPKSKAKTAYGLLSEIRKLILEEPKRYDQMDWLEHNVCGDMAPTCGTVGCVGGWTVALKGGGRKRPASFILGITAEQGNELFDGSAAGRRHDKQTGMVTNRSLLAHAKRGAAHIARFQKKYATQLKATRV